MKRIVLLLTAVLALLSTVKGSNDADAVLGKLYFVNLKEGEQPVMSGLSLFGNRCGSEDFNHKPCAAEGIRSVFELDEWIEFHPQAKCRPGLLPEKRLERRHPRLHPGMRAEQRP